MEDMSRRSRPSSFDLCRAPTTMWAIGSLSLTCRSATIYEKPQCSMSLDVHDEGQDGGAVAARRRLPAWPCCSGRFHIPPAASTQKRAVFSSLIR